VSDRRPLRWTDGLRPARLDPASRRTLLFFALKLGVILGFAALGAALDARPAPRFCAVVQALAFLAGVVATVTAYLSGEVPRGRTVDRWDEAFAFAALGLLAKIGASILGG
jgi:DMSO reductase anchor subunit